MKIAKLLIGFVVAVAVLNLATWLYFSKDEERQASEAFLRQNPQVVAEIGQVSSVTLRRHLSSHASENTGAYQLYDYLVHGEKAKANIVVRVTPTKDPKNFSYSIDSLDHYR